MYTPQTHMHIHISHTYTHTYHPNTHTHIQIHTYTTHHAHTPYTHIFPPPHPSTPTPPHTHGYRLFQGRNKLVCPALPSGHNEQMELLNECKRNCTDIIRNEKEAWGKAKDWGQLSWFHNSPGCPLGTPLSSSCFDFYVVESYSSNQIKFCLYWLKMFK